MANVTFYQSYNMQNPTMLYGDSFLVTSTKFSVSDSAGNSASYLGSNLSYRGYSVIGGTVTGFESYKNSSILLTIDNTSINAKTLQSFVDRGDRKGIEELAATGNDSIIGSSFDDSLLGYSGNDLIKGGGGNDFIDGGNGIDTAVYSQLRVNYTLTSNSGGYRVTGPDGVDTLTNIERLAFTAPTVTQAFTVLSSGYSNIFAVDAVHNPALTFVRGGTYTFSQSSATNTGHQLAFKDGTGAAYTAGVVTTGIPGTAGAQTVITVANDAPADLRYFCVAHGNSMGNSIAVLANTRIALDLAPTQSAGQTALLIGAVLPGKLVYDASKQALLGSVISLFDEGFTLAQLSGALLRLPIWDTLTNKAAPTKADIATYLVNNVYGGTQTAAITNAAIAEMNAETPTTQGTYLASLAASTANQTHVDLVGVQATGLVYLG